MKEKINNIIISLRNISLKKVIFILLLLSSLIIMCCPYLLPLFLKIELSSMLHPYESDNRPQTLTFFATLPITVISCISAYYTYKQYKTLKKRDILKIQNLINRIEALLTYHIKSLEQAINSDAFALSSLRFNCSSEKCITENELEMVFELEQLIYEHVIAENNKKWFIQRTTNIMIEIRELVYSLNTFYKLAENECDMSFLKLLQFDRANKILDDIQAFKDELYENTSLMKLKGE